MIRYRPLTFLEVRESVILRRFAAILKLPGRLMQHRREVIRLKLIAVDRRIIYTRRYPLCKVANDTPQVL